MIANEASSSPDTKPITRIATQEDVEKAEQQKDRAAADLRHAKSRLPAYDLNMNIASAEYDLDGNQFTAYYTAPERVDFRNFSRDLSKEIGARVQLLQVGDRDRAKLTDGFDICGERLCCSSWMTNFPSVSIRMAKEQDLPLNPQKISGVCGRLYCCLTFEYEDYRALRGTLPKVGAMISTPAGEARVNAIDFNREVVKLYLTESQQIVEVAAIDFQLQHGVTLRPMELVHKIEGSLRPISEDSSSAPPRRSTRPQGGAPPSRAPRPERARPARPATQPGPQASAPPPPPASEQVPAEGAAAAPRRRRRRRRGRGGSGNAGEAPTS
jgi:cell fate regulator YaaT (PSP1 superfamily)